MAGAPTHWQTLKGDADPNPEFLQVWYNEFDAYWGEELSGSGVRGQGEVVAERLWYTFMAAFMETKPSTENETST